MRGPAQGFRRGFAKFLPGAAESLVGRPHAGALLGDTRVAVAGLTLGGVVGWSVRRHGLAIDSLVSASIVTADGTLHAASTDVNADLFWALQGGAGNFGVVVDFDFVARPVETVQLGTVTYRCADDFELSVAIRRWNAVLRTAPDEVSSTLLLPPRVAGTPPSATVPICCAGSAGTNVFEADAAIEPLLGLGTVTEASIRELRYSEILEVTSQPPPQLRPEARDTLLTDLEAVVVDDIVALNDNHVAIAAAIRSLGGAFGRVPDNVPARAGRRRAPLDEEMTTQIARPRRASRRLCESCFRRHLTATPCPGG